GPTPFKFFHHWLEMDGFIKAVKDAWREYAGEEPNAMRSMMGDRGDEEVNKRAEIINKILNIDKLHSMEIAQKAKVKWIVEGDENFSFFHGMLNKKRNILNIRGVMVDGVWVDNPKRTLSEDQVKEMEYDVTNDEIKRAVWDCGTEKFPGPDGFTFGFFRRFWYLFQKDVNAAVRPISLIGSLYKIIAKIMANRFMGVLGLKQGDPLSPFLFILTMESLHLSFQLIVDAVRVLECFYMASGLRINMSKSKIIGINVDCDKVNRAAHTWNEIMERVKKRLSKWKMKTLSIGGRMTLVKSMLGSMPIIYFSIFKVPLGVIRILEGIRSHFFNGHETNSKKASWVNWKKALVSKDKGGLGISSLFAMNRGLMFKWVWRFLTQESTLWMRVIKAIHGKDGRIGTTTRGGPKSCWMVIIQEMYDLSKNGIDLLKYLRIKLGNGENMAFWEDKWCPGGILKDRNSRGGCEQDQFKKVKELIKDVILAPMSDRWTWELENTGDFSVASVRKFIDAKMLPIMENKTRWINYVPIKVNIHAWKVMTDSLPTRFNISRRGICIDSILCAKCDTRVKTASHLFFSCCMARKVWSKVRVMRGMDFISPRLADIIAFITPISKGKTVVGILSRIMVATTSYYIWQERNRRLFKKNTSSRDQIVQSILSMVRLKLDTFKFKKMSTRSRCCLINGKSQAIVLFMMGVSGEGCTLFSLFKVFPIEFSLEKFFKEADSLGSYLLLLCFCWVTLYLKKDDVNVYEQLMFFLFKGL
nr:RNA-directed DNA polymerase, eukaryota, reverse transcriptase zinc-binding domain protein [Tanacetum cinerariifolium]